MRQQRGNRLGDPALTECAGVRRHVQQRDEKAVPEPQQGSGMAGACAQVQHLPARKVRRDSAREVCRSSPRHRAVQGGGKEADQMPRPTYTPRFLVPFMGACVHGSSGQGCLG